MNTGYYFFYLQLLCCFRISFSTQIALTKMGNGNHIQTKSFKILVLPIPNTSISPTCVAGSAPVCSQDNITFPNICILMLSGKHMKSEGWCPRSIVTQKITVSYKTANNGFKKANETQNPNSPCPFCNDVYNPACGNNGVTYASRCRMDCSNIQLSRMGPCNYSSFAESPHYNCRCDYSFQPVCAQDGSTYENECAMKCGHQALVAQGACINPCNCTAIYKPVCSRKGKTFKNSCLMKCDKEEFFKKGRCPSRKPSHCSHCKGLVDPQCATNGLTYDNLCYLKCSGNSLYSKGVCPNDTAYDGVLKVNKSNCSICKMVKLPVCGQDGNTYENACLARCKGIGIKFNGKCLSTSNNQQNGSSSSSSSSSSNCSSIENNVCGTDGRTYFNECEAKAKNISVMSRRACPYVNPNYCMHLCKNIPPSPVCGQNHKTYINSCIAIKCLRISVKTNSKCQPLTQNNPVNFDFKGVQPSMRVVQPIVNQGYQNSQPSQPSYNNVNVGSRQPNSQAANNPVTKLDINNVESVIRVYKQLFPNGQSINPAFSKYKTILEGILKQRFKINPSQI